jgi:transposase-like protein
MRAIADSPEGGLQSRAIGEALGLASPTSVNRWITRALEEARSSPPSTTRMPLDAPIVSLLLAGRSANRQV